MPTQARKLGPHSRMLSRGAIGTVVNGCSQEGLFLRAVEAKLVDQVGGSPTASQRMLITRACRLSLQIELMDRKSLINGMSERSERSYLAWVNAHRRLLAQLGIDEPADDQSASASAILMASRKQP